MARALTFARTVQPDVEPILHAMIVTGCALALVLAGQPLPF